MKASQVDKGNLIVELKQRRILWASILLASFVISMVLWLTFVPRFKSVVLYFPIAENSTLASELHYVPWSKNQTDQIRHAVQALVTGPLSMKYRRILPANTLLRGVYCNGKQLWIDFDATSQAPDPECPLPPNDRFSTIIQSLKFNYPSLNSITILVDGQELAAKPYLQERKS